MSIVCKRIVVILPGLRQALASEQANDDFKAIYFDAETPPHRDPSVPM
jgi:hypothetical protein